MDIKFCSECQRGFSSDALPISGVCGECESKRKADLMILEIFKWICFSLAIICLCMLVPAFLARETSPNYYEIPGSKTRSVWKKDGLLILKIIGLIGALLFSGLGFWLKMKQSNKQSNLSDENLSIK